jgi:hypothetical protein
MRIAPFLNREGVRGPLACLAACIYLLSLALPVVNETDPKYISIHVSGSKAMSMSWKALGLWEVRDIDWWILVFAGLANPAIWFSALGVIGGAWRFSLICSFLAVLFAIPVLFRFGSLVSSHPGYWTWLASGLFLFGISGWVVYFNLVSLEKNLKDQPPLHR